MQRATSILLLLAGVPFFGFTALAQSDTAVSDRLNKAASVFQEMMGGPGTGIPESLLSRAQCVIAIPGMKKGALIVGARYGAGFASCRTASGWSAPAPVQIEGGSVGLQIGGQETDLVMFLMDQGARSNLLANSLKLGTTAQAEAGPVGESPGTTHADVLTWARANGAFAGLSVNGSTIEEDDGTIQSLYGRKLTNRQILEGGVPVPASAQNFMAALERYSSR